MQSNLICVKCSKDIGDCDCEGRDDQLRNLAMRPDGMVAFKWCRTCDKHYARCKCEHPDFYVVLGGKEIGASKGIVTMDGQKKHVDLKSR